MLTAKQDKFAQELFVTGNKSEAYRRAYSASNMADKTITEKASRLSRKDNVTTRYTQLVKAAQARNDTSVDCCLKRPISRLRKALTHPGWLRQPKAL